MKCGLWRLRSGIPAEKSVALLAAKDLDWFAEWPALQKVSPENLERTTMARTRFKPAAALPLK
jgi:hypothetical protein